MQHASSCACVTSGISFQSPSTVDGGCNSTSVTTVTVQLMRFNPHPPLMVDATDQRIATTLVLQQVSIPIHR